MPAVTSSVPAPVSNRILSKLTRPEYERLGPSLEPVNLTEDQVLYGPGDSVRHIYFPNDAIISLLLEVDQRRTVEVAMVGNEGAVGLAVQLGGVNPHSLSRVRLAGSALRLEVAALAGLVDQQGNDLKELLRRYVHALIMQIAQSGVCNRFHSIDERVARWLLMTHDRKGSQHLHATQESIANLLGVRRSSVTAAASGFHKRRIIAYRRGQIEITDHDALRAASCACYAIMKRHYDSFLN